MTVATKFWVTTILMLATILSWFAIAAMAAYTLVLYMALSAIVIIFVPTRDENKKEAAEHLKSK